MIGVLLPISNWGVWCGTPLEVVCNNHSPAPIYGGYQPWTGVFVAHVVLSVLAALAVCAATCLCIVVLGAHLVLSVFAALMVCAATCLCIMVLEAHLVLFMCWLYYV